MGSGINRRQFLSTLAMGPFFARNIGGLMDGALSFKKHRPNILWLAVEDISPEIKNLASDSTLKKVLEEHRKILTQWICETGDRGQYPEDEANLKYIYDHWGDKCMNPEYDHFKTM